MLLLQSETSFVWEQEILIFYLYSKAQDFSQWSKAYKKSTALRSHIKNNYHNIIYRKALTMTNTSRRNMLKLSLQVAGTGVVTSQQVFGAGALVGNLCTPGDLSFAEDDPGSHDFNLFPFQDPLPIIPVATPIHFPLDPPIDPARHQRYSEFLPKKIYIQVVGEFDHQYHSGIPFATKVWGFNGNIPGETFPGSSL
jgi:hypothetical protein